MERTFWSKSKTGKGFLWKSKWLGIGSVRTGLVAVLKAGSFCFKGLWSEKVGLNNGKDLRGAEGLTWLQQLSLLA
jgi:hypothetical protein